MVNVKSIGFRKSCNCKCGIKKGELVWIWLRGMERTYLEPGAGGKRDREGGKREAGSGT